MLRSEVVKSWVGDQDCKLQPQPRRRFPGLKSLNYPGPNLTFGLKERNGWTHLTREVFRTWHSLFSAPYLSKYLDMYSL